MDAFAMSPVFMLMAAVAAALAGGVCAGPILSLLVRMKSRQTVSEYLPEHAAKQGTPTMGGLIILAGFLGGMAFTLLQLRYQPAISGRYYLAATGLVLVFGLIGFIDDYLVPRLIAGKRGLGWIQKLILQIVASVGFASLLGAGSPPFDVGLGVVIILFFANAYNFSDGLDALAGSLLLAILVGLGLIGAARSETALYPLMGALAGSAIPFLWFNRPPAKVFMGDVGSLPVGALLGAIVAALVVPGWSARLTSLSSANPGTSSTLAGPLNWQLLTAVFLVSIVMFCELVPVPLQILSVKLRKRRLFPATPIHHSFQRAGWKESKVVLMFVSVQAILSIIGGGIAWSGRSSAKPNRSVEITDGDESSPAQRPMGEFRPVLPDSRPVPSPSPQLKK